MINVSEEIKDLFRDGESHAYSMTIEVGTSMYFSTPTLTITDAQIKSESAELKESLFSGENVKLGIVQTAQFTATLINVNTDLKGKYIRVKITYDADSVSPTYIPYGEFYVESFDKTAYSYERKLTAYDYSYFLNVVADNYPLYRASGVTNIDDLCYAIFDFLDLQYETFTPFQDMEYYRGFINMNSRNSNVTYAQILGWVAELYCGWWKVDRYGVFKLITIDMTSTPEVISHIRPKSCEHENTTTGAYTGVLFNGYIYTDANGWNFTDYLYGTDANPYIMTACNPFLINGIDHNIDTFGAAILAAVNAISYIPNKVQFDGRPYLEVGDLYQFVTDDDTSTRITITAPIIQSTIKGIGALRQTLDEVGTQSTSNSVVVSTQRHSSTTTSQQVQSVQQQTAENNIKFLTPQMTNTAAIADGSTSTVELFSFTVEGVQSVPVILHSMIEATVTTTISSDDYKDCVITCTLKLDNVTQKTWTETFGDGAHIFNADILLEDVDVGDHELTLSLSPVGGGLS